MSPEGFPTGELTLHGRVLPASNATFVGELGGVRVVYKPIAGKSHSGRSPAIGL